MRFEFFNRTVDNQFTFALFEFLLAGVVVVILLRKWRRSSDKSQFLLLPGAILLSLSVGTAAISHGAQFLYGVQLAKWPWSLSSHSSEAGAWLFLLLAATVETPRRIKLCWIGALFLALLSLLILVSPMAAPGLLSSPSEGTLVALDVTAALLLAVSLASSYRRRALSRFLPPSLLLFLVATLLHFQSGEVVVFPQSSSRLALWNLEQISFSLGLLLLALAMGETSANLFDTVFVRVQVVFIVLASLLILVVTRTERSEFLDNLRVRFQGLGLFSVASLEQSLEGGDSLSEAAQRENLLTRIVVDFGNNPELSAIHLVCRREAFVFEIDDLGQISTASYPDGDFTPSRFFDQNRYFLIQTFPALREASQLDRVDIYGSKLELDRHSRKRTVLIFILFTGAVGCATMLVGFVVRGAELKLDRQQKELQQASKLALVGELAGSVAHEVNNPATTIMSRASYLLGRWKKRNLPESDQEDLGVIVEEAGRIAHVTGSLLGFSRKHVLDLSPLDICDVIRRSIQVMGPDLEAAGVHISVDGCPCPRQISGDKHSLIQVFVNLFRNSIDAMPEGGELVIRVYWRNDLPKRLIIEIRDSGIGMEDEVQESVFLPFFTTKPLGKGTGLGLSVAHGIISEHQGSIHLESRRGKGTTFVIELPCL